MNIETDPRQARALPFVWAWLILLVLGGASVAVAFSDLGVWAPIIQFGFAAIQTAILFILFMRLKGPPTLKWVLAASGFVWLSFLYGLSMTDYSNRQSWPPLYAPNGPSFQLHQSRP